MQAVPLARSLIDTNSPGTKVLGSFYLRPQYLRWLAHTLLWLGVQMGLAGPIGLLRQDEFRYATLQLLQPFLTDERLDE